MYKKGMIVQKQNGLNVKALCFSFAAVLASLVTSASGTVIEGFSDMSSMAAAEGVVVLTNPEYGQNGSANEIDRVLPVKNGITVSIFGVVQDYYYSNGTGSGGGITGINVDHITNIADGLRTNPNVKVNEELAAVYKRWIKAHPFRENGGWRDNVSWNQEEMPVTADIVTDAKGKSDAAIVIIGRTAGEDHEAADVKGSYRLTDIEIDMMDKVYSSFDRMVIVLNCGGIIDMSWMKKYPKAAVVYGWQGGMEGGSATADVLTGDITPSGKLVDTIAERLEDYPAHGNNMVDAWESLHYEEDIYVGYRYFETFAPEKIVFPFGYGLSYTTFDLTTDRVLADDDKITVSVTVKNTGKVKGKEVVQIYYGAPQGRLGKPVKQLAAFAKTGVLYPGESQKIELAFNTADMASYDDSGVTGYESCYVMEAGDYNIYVGTDSHSCPKEKTYNLPALRVVKELKEVLAPTRPLRRMITGKLKDDGSYEVAYEDAPQRSVDYNRRILDNLPKELKRTSEKKYRLVDVYDGKTTLGNFIGQFTDHDLAAIVIGEENNNPARGTTGAAGCFGAVTKSLAEMGLPLAIAADGPAGIRVNKSVKVTSLPCGTMMACTWNLDLVESLYVLQGKELVLNNVDTILGPGVDIHRHPLGGRNFEYFSEDPLIVGMMACASARGIQKNGVMPTAKHFAANNLEKARREINSCISERALREIYLRGFQIAVENGNLASIMSSYNPINGTWTSSNYDLNTIVLREEWGFDGIVMTDWWSKLGADQAFYNRNGDGVKGADMVRAQQDLFMRKDQGDVERDLGGMNHLKELQNGNLTLGELQRNAKNICSYLLKTVVLARLEGYEYESRFVSGPDKFTVNKDTDAGNPLVNEIKINGKKIKADAFNPLRLEYKAFYDGSGKYPSVTASGANDTNVRVEQAGRAKNAAVITASSGKEERIYKIIFARDEGLEPLTDGAIYACLNEIKVDGKAIVEFDKNTYSYGLGTLSGDMPKVSCKADDSVKTALVTEPANRRVLIKCVSADQANTYTLQFGRYPQSDEFNEAGLSPSWTIRNESAANWTLGKTPGRLTVTAEKGDFWQGDNNLKNFFVQDAFGNWQATVKVSLNEQPKDNYKGVGIVALQDSDNYIYLKYEHSNDSVIGIFKEHAGNDPMPVGRLMGDELKSFIGGRKSLFFRLKKLGNTYTGYVSVDGYAFVSLGTTAAEYERPKFGITASAGSVEPESVFYADFDYARFVYAPVASTVEISDDFLLKVAECEPTALTPGMIPAACDDSDGGLCYSKCEKGEAVSYNMKINESGSYQLSARYKANNSNPLAQMSFTLYDNGQLLKTFSYIKSTDGKWVTRDSDGPVSLASGEHKIQIMFDTAGIDLNYLRFKLEK
jgi:beta-glucosidase-like glycosyl hydrolase